MAHTAVCLEKEVLIEDASVDEVTNFCQSFERDEVKNKGTRINSRREDNYFRKRKCGSATSNECGVVPSQSD